MISGAFTFTIPLFSVFLKLSLSFSSSNGAVSFRKFIKVLIAYMTFDDDATGKKVNDPAIFFLRSDSHVVTFLEKNLIWCEMVAIIAFIHQTEEDAWVYTKKAKTIESLLLSVL